MKAEYQKVSSLSFDPVYLLVFFNFYISSAEAQIIV